MKRKRILIIDNIEQEVLDLRRALIAAGLEVRIIQKAGELEAALGESELELIIVETRLAGLKLSELIDTIRGHQSQRVIPIIATGSPRTLEERLAVLEHEVDDFVCKPFDIDEVLARVENILNEIAESPKTPAIISKGFGGSLGEMSLVDLLQTLEVGKKTGVITLVSPRGEGRVYVTEGEVVDAVADKLEPRQALMRMFTWLEGQFSVELKIHERPQQLFVSTREIISEGMTRQFRWDQLVKALPPLSTLIEKKPADSGEEITEDEARVLRNLTEPVPLIKLIENGPFDDLKTLRLVKALLERGLLIRSTIMPPKLAANRFSPVELDRLNGQAPDAVLARVFQGMLRPPDQSDDALPFRRIERRRRERRKSDRNRQIGGGGRLWLNKTELVMIREKLLAGLKHHT